ncbi:MAG: Fpg/Nei family DNA glycosylase [Thermoflexaceae bacterium]|nr:Fpg/Nei family DNA glycosylase [Thermoflexaceae bacterium]
MPEIPELEAVRAYFNVHIAGKAILSAGTRIPVVFRTPAAELRETLPGDAFAETSRRGKFLLINLASGRVLAVNPMLTGRFQFVPPGTRLAAKTCLVLGVEGDRHLRYVDERLMGKVYLLPADALGAIPGWTKNGPDLMDPALTEEEWLRRLRKHRGQVKAILTNAEFVQGIGNAYSDEILWEARVNPYTARTALAVEDLRRLFAAAREVMARATPLVAAAMTRDGNLDYEERRDFMQVHRRGGQPCPRCGAPITEITANQRITSFCRTCQP